MNNIVLHESTSIPIYPQGFKLLKDIKVNDKVFSLEGDVTTITSTEKIILKEYSKFEFINSEEILTDLSPVIGIRKPIQYLSKDLTNSPLSKASWYAKGSISSIPDSFIFNSSFYVKETLEGILLEIGYKEGSLYVIKHVNRSIINTVRTLLSILGITYRLIPLFNFEFVILFESDEVLCTSFKKDLSSCLKYLKEEENITLQVPSIDTITNSTLVSGDKEYFYGITTEDGSIRVTESYIPVLI